MDRQVGNFEPISITESASFGYCIHLRKFNIPLYYILIISRILKSDWATRRGGIIKTHGTIKINKDISIQTTKLNDPNFVATRKEHFDVLHHLWDRSM